MPATIHHLHRVRVIPIRTLDELPLLEAQGGQDSPRVRPAITTIERERGYLEARLRDDKPDLFEQLRIRPNFGEKLDAFFRINGDLCTGICVGIALGCLLTVALAQLIAEFVL